MQLNAKLMVKVTFVSVKMGLKDATVKIVLLVATKIHAQITHALMVVHVSRLLIRINVIALWDTKENGVKRK